MDLQMKQHIYAVQVNLYNWGGYIYTRNDISRLKGLRDGYWFTATRLMLNNPDIYCACSVEYY